MAVGAHPDDIEIGAGALLAKLVREGYEVCVLILTDEDAHGPRRRREAQESAKEIGIPDDRVLFAGFRDGYLKTDRDSVSMVRSVMAAARIRPDVVIVHSNADSHNDHVEANLLARSVFRNCVLLCYSIYLSSEEEKFKPRLFIEVSEMASDLKRRALAAHRSQLPRLSWTDLIAHEERWGSRVNMSRVEAYEILEQNNSRSVFERTLLLSESPFHRFWVPIIGDSGISLIYAAHATSGATIDWPTLDESAGRDELRRSFMSSWYPGSPLMEYASDHPMVRDVVTSGCVLLVGTGVANHTFEEFYKRARPGRWRVNFDLPRTEPAYLLDDATGGRCYPVAGSDGQWKTDVGVLGKCVNPFSARHVLLRVAGATGMATRAALFFLANPESDPILHKAFAMRKEVQIAFEVCAPDFGIRIIAAMSEGE
ncbi:PIG-L deacetylase family protein [Streptomyces sp900105755]|uniref:PIG-L deacetylase family protein n=1 Tax=Streptomyces sp. 900105755 TaxID=3154389 RepID=UPI00332B3C29